MLLLDSLLLTGTAWLGMGTLLLVFAGRRPSGLWWRTAGVAAAASTAVGLSLLAGAPAAPTLGAALGIGIVAAALPRRWWAAGAVFLAGMAVSSVIYAAYLVRATLLLGDSPLGLLIGLALLVLELGALALILASAFEMVDALCTKAETPSRPPDPMHWPVVALQVPTYNEPADLVIETLRSLVALDYPALVVQVIDNNTTDEALWRPVEEEAARLRVAGHRVLFTHLPTWPGYKAGALNWGREHLPDDVELVGVIDADYVVDAGYLRAAVPHFNEPEVAFVQTPQDYRAWQESGFYRACYVGFAYFFRVGMVSRARRNSIIFAGTMGIIRRSVLDEIGGWDETIITEDAEASLRILAQGYRSVYLPTPFGRGIMPLTYEGLRKQRFRWAFGGIQILRKHWRLLVPWSRRSGLTLGQRYDHLMGGLWWFNDALTFAFTLFVVAAGLGLVVGRPFAIQRLTEIGIVLPLAFIGLNLIRYLWALRAGTGASLGLAFGALRVNLSLSWVIALASVRGLVEERGVFLRTPKFRGSPRVRWLGLVAVETAIAIGCLVLAGVTLGVAGATTAGAVVAGLLGWSLLIYSSAAAFAMTDPERAPLSATLRQKARLELAPRVGRAVRTRRARGAFAVVGSGTLLLLFGVGLLAEVDRPPVSGVGSIDDTLLGPAIEQELAAEAESTPTPGGSPSPDPLQPATGGSSATTTPTPAAEAAAPAATPAPTVTPSQPTRGQQPAPAPGPTQPAPTSAEAPASQPTPPVAVPTPSSQPTPPVPVPTPPPNGRP